MEGNKMDTREDTEVTYTICLNVFKNGHGIIYGVVHPDEGSADEANDYSAEKRIARKKITFKEGDME
jgi:hypothetical protein